MKLISGLSNLPLAQSLAKLLDVPLLQSEISHFANGEKRVWVKDEVRGENIIVVQSFSNPVDEMIMEALLLVDALERAGARHINMVIPWMGYSLQDKVFRLGEPIAAKVVANLISRSYVKRAFLLDLHNSSIPGFFSIPTDHLSALPLFVDYIKSHFDLSQTVVASPDFGGLKRARVFANELGVDLINIDKTRNLHTGEVSAVGLHGEAEGKTILVFDDVIVSGSTVSESGRLLHENGAAKVVFIATHPIFAQQAIEKINDSQIDQVLVTNSISHPVLSDKITTLDCAPIFSHSLKKWF